MEMAVVGVVKAFAKPVLKAISITETAGLAGSFLSMVGIDRESLEGHGKNVVSQGLDAVISGMDAVGDAVAGVRDTTGAAVRGAVSKVPIIGGALAGVTDALGTVVDIGGGLWSEAMSTLGLAQDASNFVGAAAFGADFVESDVEAVDGLSDEAVDKMSFSEIVRSEGIGGILTAGVKELKGIGHKIGDALGFGGADDQADASSAWSESLLSSYQSGATSDAQVAMIVSAYEAGVVSDGALNKFAAAAGQGQCAWSDLGDNLSQAQSALMRDASTSMDEFSSEVSSRVSAPPAEAPEMASSSIELEA